MIYALNTTVLKNETNLRPERGLIFRPASRRTASARINEFHVRAWHPVDVRLAFSSRTQRAWPRGRELAKGKNLPHPRVATNLYKYPNSRRARTYSRSAARARVKRVMGARRKTWCPRWLRPRGSRGSERFFRARARAHAWMPTCFESRARSYEIKADSRATNLICES